MIYIYRVELYPTCVRASAVGLCSAGGRIGGAISPLIFGLDQTWPWFSNTFFGLTAILAGGMIQNNFEQNKFEQIILVRKTKSWYIKNRGLLSGILGSHFLDFLFSADYSSRY